MKNCPQCGKEMLKRTMTSLYFSWDYDEGDGTYEVDVYDCQECGIACSVSHEVPWNSSESWKIPMEFQPTLRQQSAIKAINNILHLGLRPVTKKQAWLYINEHMEDSKKQGKRDFKDYCEDNMDWLPEYY